MYKIVTRYLVGRPRVPTPIVPLEATGDTVHMYVHANAHISVIVIDVDKVPED
jgi:hypothetical protein